MHPVHHPPTAGAKTTTTACTTPLDEPRITDKDRSRYYFWPVTEVPAERLYAHGWTGPELCIWHDRDRKRFWTSLHPTTQFDDGGSRMAISLLAAPRWSKVERVARFSAKGLADFAERALAEFRQAFVDGDAGIRALFGITEEASPDRCGGCGSHLSEPHGPGCRLDADNEQGS